MVVGRLRSFLRVGFLTNGPLVAGPLVTGFSTVGAFGAVGASGVGCGFALVLGAPMAMAGMISAAARAATVLRRGAGLSIVGVETAWSPM